MAFQDDFNPTVQKNVFQIFTRNNATKQYLYNTKIINVEGDNAPLNLQGEAKLEYTSTPINSEGETTFSSPIPVTSGLIARYNASSWNSGTSTLEDLVGSYDATSLRGSGPAVKTSSAAGGYSVLYGSSNDGIRFPTGILPQTFTLFHITRYTSTTQGRIITASNTNWLDGHWSGNAGVAYHNGWITAQTDYYDQDFFISTSQATAYRTEGGSFSTGGNNTQASLTINYGQYSEYSDWEVIEILVYDRALSTAECSEVEGWLAGEYPDATTVTGSGGGTYNVGTSTVENNTYYYDSAEQRLNSISALYSTDIFGAEKAIETTFVDADLSSGGGDGAGGEVATKERWVAWT